MKLSFSTLLFVCGTLLAKSLAAPMPHAHEPSVIPGLQGFEDEHSYDTTVESRQILTTATAVAEIGSAVASIVSDVQAGVNADNIARESFTQNVVGDLHTRNPDFNYVIVHVEHEINFDGEQGVDWGHSHQEFDIKVGGTIGYEIYWFKSGTFKRIGDGGFINWAFIGKIQSESSDGKTIVFSA